MASDKLKLKLVNLPVLGKLFLIGSNVLNLPENRQSQLEANQEIINSIDRLAKSLADALNEIGDTNEKFKNFKTIQDNLQKQLGLLEKSLKVSAVKPSSAAKKDDELFADDHLLDVFYTDFEDKFRGSEAEVENKLKIYLPYFKKSKLNFKTTPVLDIGSGRGEMLRLLKKNGIKSIGLDINLDMVERANKGGLETKQGDALSFLEESKSQSYGAITGFHLVEHIPFSSLLRMFKEAHRCLTNEGFIIFETPNPENIIVGSNTFYLDPSHLHPLPPMLLSFALETCGFRKLEILRTHEDSNQKSKNLPKEVQDRFFGPRDYAVIGYK